MRRFGHVSSVDFEALIIKKFGTGIISESYNSGQW